MEHFQFVEGDVEVGFCFVDHYRGSHLTSGGESRQASHSVFVQYETESQMPLYQIFLYQRNMKIKAVYVDRNHIFHPIFHISN